VFLPFYMPPVFLDVHNNTIIKHLHNLQISKYKNKHQVVFQASSDASETSVGKDGLSTWFKDTASQVEELQRNLKHLGSTIPP